MKQLENNILLEEMVTSLLPQTRSNRVLPYHLDYEYISLRNPPTEHSGTFLNNDLLQFDLKGTVLVIYVKGHKISGYPTELQKFTRNVIIARKDTAKN